MGMKQLKVWKLYMQFINLLLKSRIYLPLKLKIKNNQQRLLAELKK